MTEHGMTHHHPNYVAVWYWLIGLALASVLISTLPLPHVWITIGIFTAALVKAGLVALYYMHLRFAPLGILALVIGPLLLFAILLLVLFPDVAVP